MTTDSSIDGADKGDSGKICSDLLKDTGSGIYAAWAFKVNHGGELNSNYRVLEEIPEGMELAYIRIKWKGANATNVESSEIADLGSEWTKVENKTTNDDNQQQYTIYYVNKDKKQALIQLGRFQADHIEDQGSVDVQVVCRVTDPKVLLGGAEKTFTNKVVLQSANGEDLATATADAKIKDTNLTKENGYSTTSSNESQKVTYTIVANSRGQKLLTAEGEKLTLVDALGEYLSFDGESLKAKNIKTGEQVEIQSSYNPKDKTIEIVIPDETPVEITYSVTVNIAPNQKVALQNSVHWKSYSTNGGTTNKIEEFSYQLSAGGSSGTTSHPNLTIKKIDQDNTSNKLDGVEFEVSECELKDNQIQPKSETKKVKATITNGTCEITTSQFPMDFNTIYEVKETKAADGYKLDETPHYIMCVKQEEGRYPDEANAYIEYCKQMKDDTRYKVAYEIKNFFLEIYNEQKGIVVEKAFNNDAAGKYHKKNKDKEPYTVHVGYYAILTENANIGPSGNKNKAWLSYGTSQETKPEETITRTYSFAVLKFYKNADGAETGLANAKFKLYTEATCSDDKIVKLKGNGSNHYIVDESSTDNILTSPENGEFVIRGLKAGTYYLKEIEAPKGYNLLAKPIEVNLSTAPNGSGQITIYQDNNKVDKIKVENKSGTILPSTGGIGTTIFYIAGAFLVLISGVVLIAKKRTDSK